MNIFRILAAILLLHSAVVAEDIAKLLPPVIIDEFNPDVTDASRKNSVPTPGGRIIIRTPVDFQQLHAVLNTGQPEQVVINLMTDSLVEQDPETLEPYPELAWYWREADIIKLEGGEIEVGRVIDRTAEAITFLPSAWRSTFLKGDVASHQQSSLQLTPDRGGLLLTGRIQEGTHTITIDGGFGAHDLAPRIIQVKDLATYSVRYGKTSQVRPFIKMNSEFEFFLRDQVTWHDGKPFTAEDVKFSYDVLINPHIEAQKLRASFEDVESCTITENGKAVRFRYRKPYFRALSIVGGTEKGSTGGNSYFLPKHLFDATQFGGDPKAFGEFFNAHPFRQSPTYTGPYKLERWKQKDSLTLSKNSGYWKNKLPDGYMPRWNNKMPYLNKISWTIYGDVGATLKDLQSGKLDADLDVEPSTWGQTDSNTESFKKVIVRAERIGYNYTYIGWNMANPMFSDRNVRRALAMLIPADDIAANLHQGTAKRVSGPFFSQSPAYDRTVPLIPYDPAGAKRLLARAGWLDRDGDGILEKKIDGKEFPFEFTYAIHNAREYHQKMADIVKESIQQARIKMDINKTEWAIYMKSVRDKKFEAVRFAWGAELDPDPFPIWHSSQIEGGGDNFLSYKNSRVDEICELIREEMNPAKRWELGREMHRIVAEDQPQCFLFRVDENYFINRNIRGIRFYPSSYTVDFTEWYWLEPPKARQ